MRLLVLAPAPPTPRSGGGSLRMLHMLRFLGTRLEVDLVGPGLEGAAEAEARLRESCREIEFVPPSPGGLRRRVLRLGPYERDPALAAAVRRRLATREYAAVQVEKAAMLPYVPPGDPTPIVLDIWAYGLTGARRALRHDPGVATRARNLLRLARFAAFDAFRWPATHCLLLVSELDRQHCLRERPDRRVLIVPNGVDCRAVPAGPPHDGRPPRLLMTGDMSFAPNVSTALVLAARIFPEVRRVHPDAELHLVGRRPDPRVLALRGPGITVTGEVPDVLPSLHAATVFVNPQVTGGGTRTKLLEAMAAGLPIVTTSVGIEGIEARHGHEVLLAEEPGATVAAILHLLADPGERRRLGAAARRLAEDRYDWPRCLAPLDGLYAELAALKATPC